MSTNHSAAFDFCVTRPLAETSSFSLPIKLDIAPFKSGTWSLICSRTFTPRCSIERTGVSPAVMSTVEKVEMSFSLIALGPSGESLVDRPKHPLVPAFTFGVSGCGSFGQSWKYMLGYRYRLSVEVTLREEPPILKLAESAGLRLALNSLASPFPNDVVFIFPRNAGRMLWSNSIILSSASPYLKTLLASGFAEANTGWKIELEDLSSLEPLPFDDSDDEDSSQSPASPGPHLPSSAFPYCRIRVTQTSSKPYHAVLLYIYTQQIVFSPLSSCSRVGPPLTPPVDEIVPRHVSPKSVYRLAHHLEVPELQKLALESLKSDLNPNNVAVELFSEKSGTYDDVLQLLLEYAAAHRSEVRDTEEWKEKMATFGELPWGAKVAGRLAAALI